MREKTRGIQDAPCDCFTDNHVINRLTELDCQPSPSCRKELPGFHQCRLCCGITGGKVFDQNFKRQFQRNTDLSQNSLDKWVKRLIRTLRIGNFNTFVWLQIQNGTYAKLIIIVIRAVGLPAKGSQPVFRFALDKDGKHCRNHGRHNLGFRIFIELFECFDNRCQVRNTAGQSRTDTVHNMVHLPFSVF